MSCTRGTGLAVHHILNNPKNVADWIIQELDGLGCDGKRRSPPYVDCHTFISYSSEASVFSRSLRLLQLVTREHHAKPRELLPDCVYDAHGKLLSVIINPTPTVLQVEMVDAACRAVVRHIRGEGCKICVD